MKRVLSHLPGPALLLIACALATIGAGESRAAPPFFAARSSGLTLFLFGTLNVVPADLRWQTAELKRAFNSADQYCFETFFQAATDEAEHVLVREGFSNGKKLWRYLSAEQEAQLNAELGKATVSVGTGDVMAMRPWAAALTVRALLWQRIDLTGPAPNTVLQNDARRTGKSILFLETPQQTAHRDVDVPDEVAADQLRALLSHLHQTGDEATRMISSWMTGDLRRIEDQSRFDLSEQSVATRAAQNIQWATLLSPRPRLGPVVFVAVGIEHLVGPNNLRDRLEQAGFSLERVQ